MTTRFVLLGLAFGCALMSTVTLAQKNTLPAVHSPSWQKEWKQVDSLSDRGLPKSAIEIVDRIYKTSKSGKDTPQFIKAIIYKIKLNSFFSEDFLVSAIRDLETEVKQAQEPTKQILQSILAEVYEKYYENNQYRFHDRTRLDPVKTDSLQTWDLNTLMKVIYRNYLASLENSQLLQSLPVSAYKAIIEIPEPGFDKRSPEPDFEKVIVFRPTLYDFVANRALEFFTSSAGPKNSSAFGFCIDKAMYFKPADEFIKLILPTGDSLSQNLQALKIYQGLVSFHINDKDPAAFVDADLARLAFVNEKAVTGNKDSLYLDALKKSEIRLKGSPWSASISFAIARFYHSQGCNTANNTGHQYDFNQALEICEVTSKRFPDSEGAKDCRILANTIRNNELEIKNEAVVSPGTPSLALISYKNMKNVYLRLYAIDREVWESGKEKLKKEERINLLATQQARKSWQQALPDFGDYRNHSVEVVLPETTAGFFVILACSDTSFSNSSKLITYSDYTVSSLNYISRHNRDGSIGLYIFSRDKGFPLGGVTVESWFRNYNYQTNSWESKKIRSLTSDNNGFVTLPPLDKGAKFNNLYCKLISAGDVLLTESFYQSPVSPVAEKAIKQTTFFTDRAIYRPGQTVYFKGILIEKKGERTRLLPNETTLVRFTDANGRMISEKSFTTNDFASFNGSFIAPSDVLPGQMSISNESGNVSISVEQYKRPTFEVSFDPLEGNYKLGEPLVVKGKAMAYAGNAVSRAEVKYRVVRSARFPYWERWFIPFPSSPETEISNGMVKTNNDGSFSFSFIAIPDYSVPRPDKPVFDFTITTDVTDIGGETQSSEQTVTVGYQSLLLSVNAPGKFNLLTDSLMKFKAVNLNGKSTPLILAVTINKLRVPEQVFMKKFWDRPDTSLIPEKQFNELFPYFSYGNQDDTNTWKRSESFLNKAINLVSDSVINIKNYTDNAGKLQGLQAGVYEILLSADDPFHEKVSLKRFLTVYDPGSAALPASPVNWFVPLKTSAKPGDTASFLIGSKEKNVDMMFEIFKGDSLFSRKWISLSNEQLQIKVAVLESYRGNFSVNFVFSKFNRIFQDSKLIQVPYADNKLNIVFETFRSNLVPGAKEEWKINISSADKKPVSAEFLASMYDVSLDAFRANTWSFDIATKFFGTNPWNTGGSSLLRSASVSASLPSAGYSEHQYPQLNWFHIDYFGGRRYPMMLKSGQMNRTGLMDEKAVMGMAGGVSPDATPPPESQVVAGISAPSEEKPKVPPSQPMLQLRKDFRETAFFYPVLVTDSAGKLSLHFTAPESLTRWKFQGFAYTMQLEYNLIEKELVTHKDLMVMPNAPRFVRQGDRLVFSTRVVNLSGQDMNATVRIGLFDGISMKPFDSLVSGPLKQNVAISKGESAGISWTVQIPENPSLSLLQYRIIAEAGAFSDGEEKLIPVFPNRMMVTESMPLPVRGKGTFEFSFDKLRSSSAEKTLKNYRLTLEFASNPAWYALQALPALDEQQYEDAYSAFGAFYSNSIAFHIMNADPKIKAVFESWKSLTPDALLSNLEKNSQLKSLLLQQTPWVVEAQTETSNRQRLGMYFDPDNLELNLQKNLSRLKKLQTPGGGFTWFPGMPENRFMSQHIIGGLAHLEHLGVAISTGDAVVSQMLLNGVKYMDEAFRKDYNELKRRYPAQMKDNNLNLMEIQYLYSRSYYIRSNPLPAAADEALNYFLSQAAQYWMKEDLPDQAMLALALDRFGKKDISQMIIKSLSERALHSPEMGMYWAQDPGYYRQLETVETQALLIEAYDEVANDSKAVEEMKIWLLKQKQTRAWRSSRATVDACYALLLRGTKLLSEDPKIQISLGKIKIDPSRLTDIKQEAGSGYFQMSWSGGEITPEMGKVRVSKSSDGVAWGAVYWQYFENMDKITLAQTSLKLDKKLFVERNTASGPVLVSVEDNGRLNIGDKLKVRIVLKTDRDLEFVHMGDQRASAFEPPAGNTISGYHYQDGLGYYQSTADAATDFFFDYMPKGTYVFEYPLLVNAAGDYSNGITTVQCMYAPEFSAHSEGIRVSIK